MVRHETPEMAERRRARDLQHKRQTRKEQQLLLEQLRSIIDYRRSNSKKASKRQKNTAYTKEDLLFLAVEAVRSKLRGASSSECTPTQPLSTGPSGCAEQPSTGSGLEHKTCLSDIDGLASFVISGHSRIIRHWSSALDEFVCAKEFAVGMPVEGILTFNDSNQMAALERVLQLVTDKEREAPFATAVCHDADIELEISGPRRTTGGELVLCHSKPIKFSMVVKQGQSFLFWCTDTSVLRRKHSDGIVTRRERNDERIVAKREDWVSEMTGLYHLMPGQEQFYEQVRKTGQIYSTRMSSRYRTIWATFSSGLIMLITFLFRMNDHASFILDVQGGSLAEVPAAAEGGCKFWFFCLGVMIQLPAWLGGFGTPFFNTSPRIPDGKLRRNERFKTVGHVEFSVSEEQSRTSTVSHVQYHFDFGTEENLQAVMSEQRRTGASVVDLSDMPQWRHRVVYFTAGVDFQKGSDGSKIVTVHNRTYVKNKGDVPMLISAHFERVSDPDRVNFVRIREGLKV